MSDNLWEKSASQLAQMIRSGEVSSREVVEAHLARIETVNGAVNAITVVLAESALEAADKADSANNESAEGPLHGVPFTIKENIDCVGSPTTQGVPALAEALPPVDSPVVVRMKAAGAIPLARTNLPEMGLRVSTDNPLRGRTLNPWHPDRVAGGSSGGEGAAIATGMSPIGLGNDIGGSVRNPAYCCGIASLKPTIGRIPHALSIPPNDNGLAGQLMAVEGPMARHIDDLKLAYRILSGRDIRDPVSVDAPLTGPAPHSRKAGLVTTIPGVELPAQHVAAIQAAGEAMSAAGWQVDTVEPPELEKVHDLWAHVLTSEFEPIMDQLAMVMSPPAVGLMQKLIDIYPPANMPLPILHGERWRLSVAWSTMFQEYPLLIGPTWTDIPFLHDADIQDEHGETTLDILRFITPASLMGLPAASVPTGVHEGLPTGVQIVADRWRDDLALDAAGVVENALGTITPIDPSWI